MKILKQVRLYGTIKGPIWMPTIECTKEFEVSFTPDHQPFTREWTGIEDAINHITNDGDFQYALLDELYGTIQWFDGDYILSKGVEFNLDGKIFEDYVN